VLLPAAATALVFAEIVPECGSPGLRGVVAELGHRHALVFAMALFLLFSAVASYWWRRGGAARDEPARAAGGWSAVRLGASVLAAVCAALLVRAYVVQPYRVLSASMLPTFEPDDLVAGRRPGPSIGVRPPPRRGDVVVFRSAALPAAAGTAWPEVLVKRVVGLPGDVVSMRGGAPIINGWPVPSCDAGEYVYVLPDVGGHAVHGRLRVEFLDDRAYLTVHTPGAAFDGSYRVKAGEAFVLGDNRGNSLDSRAYDGGRGGGVPLTAMDARVDWFLAGTYRSGDTDLGRFLRPVDTLQTHLRLEGVATGELEDAVVRCLRNRPAETHPPPPGSATISQIDRSI
jgi:signal peptidase I